MVCLGFEPGAASMNSGHRPLGLTFLQSDAPNKLKELKYLTCRGSLEALRSSDTYLLLD